MISSIVVGYGAYLPPKVIGNNALPKELDTSDEWIQQRTGIRQRCIAENETTSDMAYKAAIKAMSDAGITAKGIDLIIVGTVTPDLTFPSVATLLQQKIGATTGIAFDISAACSGFVYALDIADGYIKQKKAKTALVIGADCFSKILDWTDRSSCVLFGDGAGAIILQAGNDANKGVIATKIFANGEYADMLKTTGGVSSTKTAGVVVMNGREVFKSAIDVMKSAILSLLEENSLKISDIDLLVPHQANLRIITALASSLDMPMDRVIVTVDQHANTSAASIPLALNHAKERLENKSIVLVSMGAGFTWGASLIKI